MCEKPATADHFSASTHVDWSSLYCPFSLLPLPPTLAQVLTCMAPWVENLNFAALWDSGWSERLLKSLYYVTWRHGDQFPDEIEKLWSTVAAKRRNIIPVINFLISKVTACMIDLPGTDEDYVSLFITNQGSKYCDQ